MSKILQITGSTGFVGQNLVSYFKSVPEIDLELTMRHELTAPRVNNNIYAVIHLAGKAHDLKGKANYQEYVDINFELTKKIYDEFLKSEAKKFIFMSSVKAAADHTDSPLTEDFTPSPTSSYGRSKLLAENYIISQPLPPGKAYFILRPCMIHGPGNKGNLNLLYQFVKRKIPYPLAAFHNRRSFLSIENLCFVIKELVLQSNISPGIYHIADNEAISTNDLVTLISRQLGIAPRLWQMNTRFVKVLAKFGDMLGLPLTSDKLNKLTENYVVDNNKLRAALSADLPVGSEEGIERTINSFHQVR